MSENVTAFPSFPRIVRPAPNPLGLFVRAGRNDHTVLLNLIAAGQASCFGAVFDPTLVGHHSGQAELRAQVLKHKLDAILDPRTQQSATPGGYSDALGEIPWGVGRPHRTADFDETSGRRLVGEIASFVADNGFTQVLSPTHYLRGANDAWLRVDVDATIRLRDYLDRKGGSFVPIIYSLAIPYAVLRDKEQRSAILHALQGVPASELWLKVDGAGSGSTATAVQNYIEAATEFHELGIPIVADHMGGLVGLALMAFGAVSGIAHGVTLGEQFNASHWRHRRESKGFGLQRRVYVPSLDMMLSPEDASIILASTRAKALFGCSDSECCPRAISDMIENSGRHFLVQRIAEVMSLSQIPETLRPQRFLEQCLRPATDKAVAAAQFNWDDRLTKKMQENRKRLDHLRIALGNHVANSRPNSFAVLPKTRVARGA